MIFLLLSFQSHLFFSHVDETKITILAKTCVHQALNESKTRSNLNTHTEPRVATENAMISNEAISSGILSVALGFIRAVRTLDHAIAHVGGREALAEGTAVPLAVRWHRHHQLALRQLHHLGERDFL